MRFLVLKLDEFIRKSNGVIVFSQDQDCLLRLQVVRAPHEIQHTKRIVETDEQILLLQLWNERLPSWSKGNTDLAWAGRILHLFYYSLGLVAEYLREEPRLGEVRAVGGVMTILLRAGLYETGSRLVQKMGVTVMPYSNRLGRFGEFWENFYSWLII